MSKYSDESEWVRILESYIAGKIKIEDVAGAIKIYNHNKVIFKGFYEQVPAFIEGVKYGKSIN